MDADTQFSWLLLNRLPSLYRADLARLLMDYPEPSPLLELPEMTLAAYGVPAEWLAARQAVLAAGPAGELWRQALRDRETVAKEGIELLPYSDPDYPALLREIADPPLLLSLQGKRHLLARPQLAVVGSRRAGRRGLADARNFSATLAAAGMGICSGLALGIDAAAHRGALSAEGDTVAVLGCGLGVSYPPANRALQREIADCGLVISELPPDAAPLRGHFPRRNRIISGLSLGVLVVEATLRSGSLITARLALEQGREVFALPGSIHNPGSRGCNRLLSEGAMLVEGVEDILDALGGWTAAPRALEPAPAPPGMSSEESRVLAVLGFEPTPLDLLVAHSGLAVNALLPLLTALELRGLIERRGGNWQRCA